MSWSIFLIPVVLSGGESSFTLNGLPVNPHWGQYFAPADLDGDGTFDWIFEWSKSGNWTKVTDTGNKLAAYSSEGERLWIHEMNITQLRVQYSPYVAFDLDDDGRDEVYLRDSSIFGKHRPGVLKKLDPETGELLRIIDWPKVEGLRPVMFMTLIAWLDGQTPSLILVTADWPDVHEGKLLEGGMLDIVAYDKDLVMTGRYTTGLYTEDDMAGTLGHQMSVADVDNDGRDEIIIGSAVVDDDLTPLWSAFPGASATNDFDFEHRHSDVNICGDILPDNPGLEIWLGGERRHRMGILDAATGAWIWQKEVISLQGPAFAGDIDPEIPGMELYAKDYNHEARKDKLWTATGEPLPLGRYCLEQKDDPPGASWNWSIWWKGTPHMQVINVDGPRRPEPVAGWPKNNFVGDVLGDWREEYCWGANGEFHILTAEGKPEYQRPPLREDRKYYLNMIRGMRASGYYERPLPGKPLF